MARYQRIYIIVNESILNPVPEKYPKAHARTYCRNGVVIVQTWGGDWRYSLKNTLIRSETDWMRGVLAFIEPKKNSTNEIAVSIR